VSSSIQNIFYRSQWPSLSNENPGRTKPSLVGFDGLNEIFLAVAVVVGIALFKIGLSGRLEFFGKGWHGVSPPEGKVETAITFDSPASKPPVIAF
jgi:hypothetical protein